MPHIVIDFQTSSGADHHLGKFEASLAELAALRALLEQHNDPLEALDRIKAINQMLFDILDVCRLERHRVRIRFEDSWLPRQAPDQDEGIERLRITSLSREAGSRGSGQRAPHVGSVLLVYGILAGTRGRT